MQKTPRTNPHFWLSPGVKHLVKISIKSKFCRNFGGKDFCFKTLHPRPSQQGNLAQLDWLGLYNKGRGLTVNYFF